MKRWLRILYYLLINVAVSACTVLAVLALWERTHGVPVATLPPPTLPISGAQASLPAPGAAPASSATAAPAPTLAPLQYQVQAGDTLAAIATRYDLSMAELIAANNLADPNALDVGQWLIIPTEPPPATLTPTPAPSATPGPSPTPLPTLPPAASATTIPADVAVPIEIVTVVGAGVVGDERVIIKYNGDGSLRLAGWELETPAGLTYTFPELTLFTGGAVTVYTHAGTNTVVELFWGRDAAAWQPGDIVLLRDTQGIVRASAQAP